MPRTQGRHLPVLLGLFALLLGMPAAASAESHVDVGELTIEPTTVQPGESFTVSGACPEAAGGEELVVLGTDPGGGQLGTVTADDDGSFSGEASVSENSPPGDLEVTVVCDVDDVVLRGTLTVAGAEAPDEAPDETPDETPVGGVETGFGGGASSNGTLATLIGALGLLFLAGGAVVLRRQRA